MTVLQVTVEVGLKEPILVLAGVNLVKMVLEQLQMEIYLLVKVTQELLLTIGGNLRQLALAEMLKIKKTLQQVGDLESVAVVVQVEAGELVLLHLVEGIFIFIDHFDTLFFFYPVVIWRKNCGNFYPVAI